MLRKTKQVIDIFFWRIKPRVYVCRDVLLVKWMDREFIIPRMKDV